MLRGGRGAVALPPRLLRAMGQTGTPGAPSTPAPNAAAAAATAASLAATPAAAPPAATPAPAPAAAAATPSDTPLADLLSQIAGGLQMPAAAPAGPTLTQTLARDNIAALLDDAAVCARLYPLLPEGAPHTRTELEAVVRSPQFHQAVAALDAGLQQGEAAPLAIQLGLDASVGGPFGGTCARTRSRHSATASSRSLCGGGR
jgi:hypothetical protein